MHHGTRIVDGVGCRGGISVRRRQGLVIVIAAVSVLNHCNGTAEGVAGARNESTPSLREHQARVLEERPDGIVLETDAEVLSERPVSMPTERDSEGGTSREEDERDTESPETCVDDYRKVYEPWYREALSPQIQVKSSCKKLTVEDSSGETVLEIRLIGRCLLRIDLVTGQEHVDTTINACGE